MTLPATLESAETEPGLAGYIKARIAEFDQIPTERRAQLQRVVLFADSQRGKDAPIRLTFICTHNSRRSQMAQVWATLAASHYGVRKIEVFSGGTEGTAFNPRAVAALKRAGVTIEPVGNTPDADNPKYEVRLGRDGGRLICFSKKYDQTPNPRADFAAVMVCADAEKNCPNVAGALERISLPYEDPKVADGTAGEAKAYDEHCAQIAREMLLVFSQLAPAR
jgi:arsenate reductase